MEKPTLHLATLSGKTPEEQVQILGKLLERLTGKPPTPEDLAKALQRLKAVVPKP